MLCMLIFCYSIFSEDQRVCVKGDDTLSETGKVTGVIIYWSPPTSMFAGDLPIWRSILTFWKGILINVVIWYDFICVKLGENDK